MLTRSARSSWYRRAPFRISMSYLFLNRPSSFRLPCHPPSSWLVVRRGDSHLRVALEFRLVAGQLRGASGEQTLRERFNFAPFHVAKIAVGMEGRDRHFHDLRGTAATQFYTAGLSVRVIAEIMGGEEEHVEKIIRRYVGRNAATKAAIAQLNRMERGEE
jgi:integrase